MILQFYKLAQLIMGPWCWGLGDPALWDTTSPQTSVLSLPQEIDSQLLSLEDQGLFLSSLTKNNSNIPMFPYQQNETVREREAEDY